jgi:predicted Zn-dependent protease
MHILYHRKSLILFLCLTLFSSVFVLNAEGQGDTKGKGSTQSVPAVPKSFPNSMPQDAGSALNQMDNAIKAAEEEDFTPEDSYYLGRAVAANVLVTYPVWNNPALVQYLDGILAAIVVNSPKPEIFAGYHVILLDTNEANAFATPGGHILVSRGLISLTDSEDALAAVIAHEVGHIQLQHSETIIKELRVEQSLIDTGSRANEIATRNMSKEDKKKLFNNSVRGLVDTMMRNGYSQKQEFEADKYALSLLTAAGYDPRSFVDVLRSMEKYLPSHPGGLGSTHPAPALRIAQVEPQVKILQTTDTRSFRKGRFKNK